MERFYLRLFQNEVDRQCRFAILAYEDIQRFLKSDDHDRFWYSIQSFLVSVGDLSKLLWPNKEHLTSRGAELRKSLGVDENSPLKPRSFRNKFEHFDTQIEEWAIKSKSHNYADSIIGPLNAIVDLDKGDLMRWYNPESEVLLFQGEQYYIKPILNAIQALQKKAHSQVFARIPMFNKDNGSPLESGP